ncbi:MAG TPA: hypothetical protein PKA99_06835, partial [Dermatophilaceae bacterium]|nr:hypothetical protein [Dermatophilaceae bacterium]
MTPPSSVEPELLTAALPGGWEAVTGPGIAIAVELSPGDPRLPHLRAAVGSGRFDDALQVLGRFGGPPPCAAAAVVEGGSGVRIVVAKQAHAEASVAGRTVEIRPQPPGDWAQVLLHDVESVLLVPGLGMPSAPVAPVAPVAAARPAAPVPPAVAVHPDVLASPVPDSVRMESTPVPTLPPISAVAPAPV